MAKTPKNRIDLLLVQHGFAKTAGEAQALLMAGEILVNNEPVTKAGQTVPADAEIRLRNVRPRYVSRGGLKLEGALKDLQVDPTGLVCADIGASTGGFTDCLLQHGAVKVHAIDVGQGLIAEKLRQDPRVVIHDKLNARGMTEADLGERVTLAVADCSFISLTLILGGIRDILESGGVLVALVKPQFEADRDQVGEGGIVRDETVQRDAVRKIAQAAEASGFTCAGESKSPITGVEGNQEYFLKLLFAGGR